MNKLVIFLLVVMMLAFTACQSTPADTQVVGDSEMPVMDSDSDEMVVDDEMAEIVVDMDEEALEAAQIGTAENMGEFCLPGDTFTFSNDEENTVDSIIVGLTTYEGKEMCQADSSMEIESPVGVISTQTTYYFDATYEEYYVLTTVTSDLMPQPQVTEVHIVNGEVVA